MEESYNDTKKMETDFSNVVISPMLKTDVLDIKRLEILCSLSPWAIDDYRKEIGRSDSLALKACLKDKIVGFVIARLIITEKTKLFDIDIYNLCVDYLYRRKNIGSQLLKALHNPPGININAIRLEVRKSNFEAYSFYQKNNFSCVQIRRNFYTRPVEDALVMELKRA